MVQRAQARAFEVSDVADEELIGAWERHNRDELIELECRVPEGRPFRAREITVAAGGLRLAAVAGTPHTVERDEQMVAARPADAIAVYAALRGEAIVDYQGARSIVRPGQLLVCDLDRPMLRGFGHGLHELAVRIPRQDFDAFTGMATLEPLVLDAAGRDADPYARALVRLVGRAVAQRRPVPAEEQAVLELVSVLATRGAVGSPMAHRAAARAYIDDHLTDPSLSAAAVAAGAGISERHLSRLFAEAGTSVPRQILARRLDTAFAMLAAPEPGLRTSDVAARCGFTSRSYFSEAFRARFGATAGAVARAALEDAAPSPG